jgi:hypothetical protein
MTPEQIAAFLADLTELSRKHGIVIGGCGCCDSPNLSPLDTAEEEARRCMANPYLAESITDRFGPGPAGYAVHDAGDLTWTADRPAKDGGQ